MEKSRLIKAINLIDTWSVERPIFLPAGLAHELHTQGIESNYYIPLWWGTENDDQPLLSGFTGFIFGEGNKVGQSELNVLLMNKYDTAHDVPSLIDFREWIYAPNLAVPDTHIHQCVIPSNP